MPETILCSGCFRDNCLFNGTSNTSELELRPQLQAFINGHKAFYFCPEVSGGLPTPRPASRICGLTDEADGFDVLDGKAKVITDDGDDVTEQFLAGANQAVELCKEHGIKVAVLKRTSPSCGFQQTQGGVEERKKVQGNGVMASALIRAGISVINEKEFPEE